MQPSGPVTVQDKGGVRGAVIPTAPHTPDSATHVSVQLENGVIVRVPAALLVHQADGSYSLSCRPIEHEHAESERHADDSTYVIPVVVEEVDIQKRLVETGKVRITKVVHEHESSIEVPLYQEQVHITRVPIERVVDGPIPVRYEGDTVIISRVEEVPVIEKRLVLQEEIHIQRQRLETQQVQHVTLRREDVRVDRIPNATEQGKGPSYG
jgi:uncharacterized protein (TIGR02271 family)